MTLFVPLAMFGWPLVSLLLFAFWPKRRAMLVGMNAAWSLLPVYAYMWPGPLKWTKSNAVSFGLLLGVIAFDFARLGRFRPRLIDIPALVLCVWPIVSAFSNGLGIADAGAGCVENIGMYGIPYMLGRLYIEDATALMHMARVVLAAVLLYVPLCVFEIRMSPMLHYTIYGFFQHQWAQMVRDGGYRPIVFMQHGLAVAMWMAAGTIIAYGLWRGTRLKRLWRAPMVVWVVLLVIMTLERKSAGAIMLALIGCATIEAARCVPMRWLLCGLLLIAPAYMAVRTTGLLNAERITSTLELVFPYDRVASAADRLHQEDVLSEHALQRPLVGWGPWGGYRLTSNDESLVGHTDSMWIIVFGKYGAVGLAAASLLYLLPALFAAWRLADSSKPADMLLFVLALVPIFAMIDNLSNYMPNPMFVMIAGAVGTLAGSRMSKTPCANPRRGEFRPKVSQNLKTVARHRVGNASVTGQRFNN